MDEKRVTLAVVAGAHGISGEVRLKLFTADVGDFTRYRSYLCGDGRLTLTSTRQGSRGVLAKFDGIDDRNAAEALRGAELAVPRSSLPPLEPGEYYHTDLIGRAVVLRGGESIGTVTAIENFGAGDILEIAPGDGPPFMVPAAVAEIDDPIIIDPDFLP